MRGITVERRIVDFLRGRGVTILQSEELDHLKIDFVFVGNQTGELKRGDMDNAIAVQITTAPTHFKKFENFVQRAESNSFPYRRKLYIAIGKRGAPTPQLLHLIYAILLTLRYNREDELSNAARVACVIFADCTYQMVQHGEYQQLINDNLDNITNIVEVNEVPVGTISLGDVYTDLNVRRGYCFVSNAGGKRFFVHQNEQDDLHWNEIVRRFHAGRKKFRIRFSVLEYTDEYPAQKVKVLEVLD